MLKLFPSSSGLAAFAAIGDVDCRPSGGAVDSKIPNGEGPTRFPPGVIGGGPRVADDEPALQDRLPMHCFGCGTLNAAGLHIKSRWFGNEFVCVWQPGPQHVGYPGYVFGGTIASIVDCHAIWAAFSFRCAGAGHDLDDGPPPFIVVTASLRVNYLQPAALSEALELRARIVDHGARKTVVACSVQQGTVERATAEVITVTVAGVR